MSLRRLPQITPALLAANRLNAQKSIGPRTVSGLEMAAMNSFKHGLRSKGFRENMLVTSESREKVRQAAQGLLQLLKPRNRPETLRVVRYAQMLWAINRRFNRNRFHRTRRKGLMELSGAERALHNLVKKDLRRTRGYVTAKERRKSYPIMGLINLLDLMPNAGRANHQHDERTRNVL
ncbi:MAG TPA: hypothetical protein VKV95_09400 [Terriglobia bacterium]|nr:hypothetical protein [Terriglobia bacterium]